MPENSVAQLFYFSYRLIVGTSLSPRLPVCSHRAVQGLHDDARVPESVLCLFGAVSAAAGLRHAVPRAARVRVVQPRLDSAVDSVLSGAAKRDRDDARVSAQTEQWVVIYLMRDGCRPGCACVLRAERQAQAFVACVCSDSGAPPFRIMRLL
jgi:hypothetical protein